MTTFSDIQINKINKYNNVLRAVNADDMRLKEIAKHLPDMTEEQIYPILLKLVAANCLKMIHKPEVAKRAQFFTRTATVYMTAEQLHKKSSGITHLGIGHTRYQLSNVTHTTPRAKVNQKAVLRSPSYNF